MPNNNDFIKVTMISELAGVQMQNQLYWEVEDVGTNPPVSDALQDIMDAYVASITSFVSDKWALTCAIYENLTSAEAKAILFGNQPATGTGDSHPQDQVFAVRRYARKDPGDPIFVGRFNQSGVEEAHSVRGRVTNPATFQPLIDFLQNVLNLPGGSWTLDPHLFVTLNPGPPPVKGFRELLTCQLDTVVRKIRSRKTNLCITP